MAQEQPTSKYSPLIRDWVLWALAAVFLVVLLTTVFPGLNPEAPGHPILHYLLIPVLLIAMAAPWVGLPRIQVPVERSFWRLWTFSLASVVLARILYVSFDEVRGTVGLCIDAAYALFYLSIVMALQVKPDRRKKALRWRAHDLLEASGTSVFVLVLLLYFVLIPPAFSPQGYDTWIPGLGLYVSLDVYILLALLYLRQTCADPPWRIVYSWLALAALTWAITDLVELLAHLEVVDISLAGPLDFLRYIPWVFFVMGARVRAHPVPEVFTKLAGGPERLQSDELLARPVWLVVLAAGLPLIHFGANLLGLLPPETRSIREFVVLVSLVLLLGLALGHQKAIQRRVQSLAKKNREAEEFLRLLAAAVEQSADAMVITDAHRVVRYVNPAFEANGGVPEDVLLGPLEKALPIPLESAGEEGLDEALAGERAWEGRHETSGPDGNPREELVTVSPVWTPQGELAHWVVVLKDVTYLAQLERQFRQTQKMEALGTLAGGIAHDFNNILGAIYGYGEMLAEVVDPGSQAQRDLDGLLSAAERAAELVKQILTFSRQEGDEWETLALQPAIGEALMLLRATLPSTIRIREDMQESHLFVRGARDQIHQVILNLGANAAHAMGEAGGVLDIDLGRVFLDGDVAEVLGVDSGEYARITVQDTGAGMDEATLDRIFDPFFTTKGVGEGTGLGLSVVHGAVRGHGGGLRVESEPGEGTRFEVFLPRALPSETGEDGQHSPPPTGNGRRLLIVDDEPMLAGLSRQILEGLGYRVTAFTDSSEALEFLLRGSDEIEAVVTDQTMPGITGLELARRLRDGGSTVPILLTTGYSEVLSPERLQEAGIRKVLMKPFNRRELGWAVADLMA